MFFKHIIRQHMNSTVLISLWCDRIFFRMTGMAQISEFSF